MTPEQILTVGCKTCGASSHEPCISERTSRDRVLPHAARIEFAWSLRPRITTHRPDESPDE